MQDDTQIDKLTKRSREVFRCLVETYINTGDPVGSRTLAKSLVQDLSSSTVRNIMQDLEELGLLGSFHSSLHKVCKVYLFSIPY